jgi:mono/diheme cytochrome c family protein
MSRRSASVLLAVLGGMLLTAAFDRPPQPRVAQRTVWDSVYSATQAGRGESAYAKTCSRCHQASLSGADESPALTGSTFLGNWNGLSVGELHERIRKSMPPDDPGTYDRTMITDVIAYMFKVNGFPAGAADLSTEPDSLKAIMIQSSKP